MKIENCKLKIAKHDAFTLIEIMVVIAIIGILSALVLVSMKSYGAKARASKAMAQLSSAIPSMVSCWGNGNVVNSPGSDAICAEPGMGGADIAGYGKWPSLGSGDLANYSYSSSFDISTPPPSSGWYFFVTSGSSHDNLGICCNNTLSSCEIIGLKDTCNGNTPSN